MDKNKRKDYVSMRTIRMEAINIATFELVYPPKGKQRRPVSKVAELVEYHARKEWRYGWNACASFTQSFPDGERLEASLKGGLRIKV